MIPFAGLEEMVGVGVFLYDRRAVLSVVHTAGIAVVAAEAGGGVMVASVAEVVELQGVGVDELSSAFVKVFPRVRSVGVGGHPEAVEVAEAVVGVFGDHLRVVFDDRTSAHLVFAPDAKTLGSGEFGSVAAECHLAGTLGFYFPVFIELLGVKPGDGFSGRHCGHTRGDHRQEWKYALIGSYHDRSSG